MRDIRVTVFTVSLALAAVVLSSCGPSESEIQQMIDAAITNSEQRIAESVQTQNTATFEKAAASNTAAIEKVKASIDASNQDAVEEMRAMIKTLYESTEQDFEEATDTIYGDIDDLGEASQLLVGAICQSDYWANAAFAMIWWTIIYLEGGDAPLENIKAFANGFSADEYNDVAEGVCVLDETGRFRLK